MTAGQNASWREKTYRLFTYLASAGLRRRTVNAHGQPARLANGHAGCTDRGDLGPCDCLCHRDET